MKKLVCGCFGTIYYAQILKNGLMSHTNRKDVTDDAISAVIEHIMLKPEYKKNDGLSGYDYSKIDGGIIAIAVFDKDKYKLVRKSEGEG